MDLNLTYIDFSIARILNSHSSEMHLHHLILREEQEPIQLLKEEVRIVVIEVFRRSMEAKLFLPLNPFPNSFTVEGRMT